MADKKKIKLTHYQGRKIQLKQFEPYEFGFGADMEFEYTDSSEIDLGYAQLKDMIGKQLQSKEKEVRAFMAGEKTPQ